MALANQTRLLGESKVVDLAGRALTITEVSVGQYATNGIAVAASDVGLRQIDVIVPVVGSGGYTVAWDRANSKIKVHQQPGVAAAGAHPEVPNATDLSALKVTLIAIGVR